MISGYIPEILPGRRYRYAERPAKVLICLSPSPEAAGRSTARSASSQKDAAALIRGVVRALGDPACEADARALLRERFGEAKAKGLKALLAAAPLEGIDLTRARDLGRDIAL